MLFMKAVNVFRFSDQNVLFSFKIYFEQALVYVHKDADIVSSKFLVSLKDADEMVQG